MGGYDGNLNRESETGAENNLIAEVFASGGMDVKTVYEAGSYDGEDGAEDQEWLEVADFANQPATDRCANAFARVV